METNWANICFKATSLTSDEARDLEEQLVTAPDAAHLRVRLVGAGYLSTDPILIARRVEHLAWLAEHRPDIDLSGFAFIVPAMVDERRRLKELWSESLSQHPDDLRVLKAAGSFLSFYDPTLALRAYDRASALEPENGDWKQASARMHARLAEDADDEVTRNNHLRSAESALNEAFTMASSDDQRSVLLQDLAWNAVAAERWDAATIVAGKLLESAEACRGTWQYGNAVHHGHIVLGEVAVARRDFDRAERELREAAATPGSPQLNSFGPNLDLAAALARLGRRDAVIEYLENCKAFLKHKDVEIDEWLATLRRGELPAFAVEETESEA